MTSFLRSLAFLPLSVAFGLGLVGCAASHDEVAAQDEESAETAGAITKLPAPAVASQRLYFDNAQPTYLTDDAPLTY